jgi:hypothetical protein
MATKISKEQIQDQAVETTQIKEQTIQNSDVSPSAAIDAGKLNSPGCSAEYLSGDGVYRSIDTSGICTNASAIATNAFNISLLGFKMAVNEGLTVFNLVDGVVDEFNDESGVDTAENVNDGYDATCDFYQNLCFAPVCINAGFTTTSITEPETSTAGTNATTGVGCAGTFTVPCGVTDVAAYLWGAGGNQGARAPTSGGGGGFVSGCIAVTGGQSLGVFVAEGADSDQGAAFGNSCAPGSEAGGGQGSGHGGGGGGGGFIASDTCKAFGPSEVPAMYLIAGGGGSTGHNPQGGAGGGTNGQGGFGPSPPGGDGGGGSQTGGGSAGGGSPSGQAGALFSGGQSTAAAGGGGGGYYGGGGGGQGPMTSAAHGGGGGGSSYTGHPSVSCAVNEGGSGSSGGGTPSPFYVAGTNEGGTPSTCGNDGEDGYALFYKIDCVQTPGGTSSIFSDTFTATTAPTSARIVVFEEDVETPTLNTDVIASVSRDGGSNYTTATLSDSGYVTGSSGQRILTGTADISGQPSGTSMRWKIALANNTVKIHGVSLQWA